MGESDDLRKVEEERRRQYLDLPPSSLDPHLLVMIKVSDYIAVILQNQHTGERVQVFTLHRHEARLLSERLQKVMTGPDGNFDLVEGVTLGGPPRPDELAVNRMRR